MIPKPLTLKAEDYHDAPSWITRLFQQLNDWFSVATLAFTGALTRADNLRSTVKTISFTTLTPASSTFPLIVKHDLGQRVSDAWLGRIRRVDGAALSSAYGFTWDYRDVDSEISVRFQGLSDATRYEARIILE